MRNCCAEKSDEDENEKIGRRAVGAERERESERRDLPAHHIARGRTTMAANNPCGTRRCDARLACAHTHAHTESMTKLFLIKLVA